MSSEMRAIIRRLGLNMKTVMIDSPVDIEIRVGMADIRHAQRKEKTLCVLARAACRSLPDVSDAFMYRSAAWLHQVMDDGTEKFVRFKTSPEAQRAIEHFDSTGKWEIGKFKLLAPKGANTLKRIAARSAKRKGRHQPGPKKEKVRRNIKVRTRQHWATL